MILIRFVVATKIEGVLEPTRNQENTMKESLLSCLFESTTGSNQYPAEQHFFRWNFWGAEAPFAAALGVVNLFGIQIPNGGIHQQTLVNS